MSRPPRLLAALLAGAAASLVAATVALAAGPEVDVSNAPGPQSEVAAAVDPSSPGVLLAASNSLLEHTMRVYGSTDGGATWSSTPITPPRQPRDERSCMADPGVAIDATGRQYLSFLSAAPCSNKPHLFVLTRRNAQSPWPRPRTPVWPLGANLGDDKPAIAVDTSPGSPYLGRLYVAWSRVTSTRIIQIAFSHSDDHGRTWSHPVQVNGSGRAVTYASIAIGPGGTVYVAWDDPTFVSLMINRSTDGGETWKGERLVAKYRDYFFAHCGSGTVIRAAGLTCVRPNPIVTVDRSDGPYRGRVYVSYGDEDADRIAQDVYLSVFDPSLRQLSGWTQKRGDGIEVTPPQGDPLADRFWPASAIDQSTGRLWVCFYDTTGDRARRQVRYACISSADGGQTFTAPVSAASVTTNETLPGADGRQFGDYEGLAAGDGFAYPFWTDSRDLALRQEEIYSTRLSAADLPGAG